MTNLGGTAERKASFVPDVDEGFFVYLLYGIARAKLEAMTEEKEARMKKRFRMNYILRTASPVFWKEGPLLFDVAHVVPMFLRENQLSRLLHESNV